MITTTQSTESTSLDERRKPIVITKKQVARGVRKLARQEPLRSNAATTGAGCSYRAENGMTPCLIGALVADIVGTTEVWEGVPNSHIGLAARTLKYDKGVAFTPKALALASKLQAAADAMRTTPWSEIVPEFTTSSD